MDPFVASLPRPFFPADASYPSRLNDLPVPPRQLWVDGRLPFAGEKLVAIVGSRATSRAAVARVASLAAELAGAGWAIISGGALGIDAAAHRGALEGGGPTFAVLGCGVDVVYPDRHAGLFREIAAKGGVLSEYAPGVPPRPGQFPARNRLVAALAGAVVVADCRTGSGALITARLATGLGRPLFAMPGSAGTDNLIASGAAVEMETASDLRRVLTGEKLRERTAISASFTALLAALAGGALGADAIALMLNASLADTLGLLVEAELGGLVARTPGGKFEGRRGH